MFNFVLEKYALNKIKTYILNKKSIEKGLNEDFFLQKNAANRIYQNACITMTFLLKIQYVCLKPDQYKSCIKF